MDLAGVLNVPPQALSLNGRLGIAFGARGRGGKNSAKAHYEPGQVVINLTKNKGAGSLAHEWFHALDNFFGQSDLAKSGGIAAGGEFITRRWRAVRNLQDGKWVTTEHPVRQEVYDAFKGVINAIKASALHERSGRLDKVRSKAYWSTDIELAARAFERYVQEKAKTAGIENDYLVNIRKADEHGSPETYAYPTSAELDGGINQAFDKLFSTLKTKKTDKGITFYSKQADKPEHLDMKTVGAIAKEFVDGYKGKLNLFVRVYPSQEAAYGEKYSVGKFGKIRGGYEARNTEKVQKGTDVSPVEIPEGSRDAVNPGSSGNNGTTDTHLPLDLRGGGNARTGNTENIRGIVKLNAAALGTKAEVETTLRHEILGHYGLNTFSRADKLAILKAIDQTREAPAFATLWETVKKNYPDKDYPPLAQAEEVFAHAAQQEKTERSARSGRRILPASVMHAFHQALRKSGLVNGKMSIGELYDAIDATADGIRAGRRPQINFPKHNYEFRQQTVRSGLSQHGKALISETGKTPASTDTATGSKAPKVTVKEAENIAGSMMKDVGDTGLKVLVVKTQAQAEVLAGEKTGDLIHAMYLPEDKTIVLVADNLKRGTVREKLRHELIHHAMEHLITQDEYNSLLRDIADTRNSKNPQLQKVWRQTEKNYADSSPEVQAAEFLAHMAEKHQPGELGIRWERFVNAVKTLLHKAGIITDGTFSDLHQVKETLHTLGQRLRDGYGNRESRGYAPDDRAKFKSQEKNYVSWDEEQEYRVTEDGEEVPDGDPYWLIGMVHTDPAQRGQGIARRNMEGAIDEMLATDPDKDIRLVSDPQDSDTDTEKLNEFYESMGFYGVDYGPDGTMQLSKSDYRDYRKERAKAQGKTSYSREARADPFKVPDGEGERYRAELAKTMKSLKSNDMTLKISNTPPVLRHSGAPDLPLIITRDTVRKATNGVKHVVPMEVIERLPELMHDPEAVYRSATQKDAMIVLLNAVDKNGDPVVSALHLQASQKLIKVNRIASVYGTKGGMDKMNSMDKAGLALYKKQNPDGSLYRGLQLPKDEHTNQGHAENILHPEDIRNRENKIFYSKEKDFSITPPEETRASYLIRRFQYVMAPFKPDTSSIRHRHRPMFKCVIHRHRFNFYPYTTPL